MSKNMVEPGRPQMTV